MFNTITLLRSWLACTDKTLFTQLDLQIIIYNMLVRVESVLSLCSGYCRNWLAETGSVRNLVQVLLN